MTKFHTAHNPFVWQKGMPLKGYLRDVHKLLPVWGNLLWSIPLSDAWLAFGPIYCGPVPFICGPTGRALILHVLL